MLTKRAMVLSVVSAFSLVGSMAFAKNVDVDLGQSKLGWVGKKVLGQHNGVIKLKSGVVDIDGNNLKGGSFEVDMTSIVVEDVKDPKSNADLTGHLKSDDFFGVANHGTAIFKITSVKPLADKSQGTHEITGDLTIKGATHPVTFPATIEFKGKQASAKGKMTVDRTKYDIRYRSLKFFGDIGDKAINDNFEIDLDLKTKI